MKVDYFVYSKTKRFWNEKEISWIEWDLLTRKLNISYKNIVLTEKLLCTKWKFDKIKKN